MQGLTAKERVDRFQGKNKNRRPSARKSRAEAAASDNRPQALPPPPDAVEAYYDSLKGGFFTRNDAGEFQRVDKDTLGLELRATGYHKWERHSNGLSFLEGELLRLTKQRSVHYAGPVGGFSPGRYDMLGTRVLVTTGPRWLTPEEGQWPLFRTFLEQLLRDQARYFCAWIKWALESVRRGLPWSPGQMLAIAGPPGCGKSFLQSLITPMLGGRVSKPYQFLTGKSNFNAEIFGSEHAMIADEVPEKDHKSRRNFGSGLKNLVANKEQAIATKNKTPITLTPFLRVTMTLNDNADSLLVLPPLDSEVEDKIILLRATAVKFPWPSKRFPDSQSFHRAIEAELPAFLFHLRRWRIPEALHDQRYGVVSFKDPALMEAVRELSPEFRLWELIERHIFEAGYGEVWTGHTAQLIAILSEANPREAEQLLRNSAQAGQYLGRLREHHPDKVQMTRGAKNKAVWTLRNK